MSSAVSNESKTLVQVVELIHLYSTLTAKHIIDPEIDSTETDTTELGKLRHNIIDILIF